MRLFKPTEEEVKKASEDLYSKADANLITEDEYENASMNTIFEKRVDFDNEEVILRRLRYILNDEMDVEVGYMIESTGEKSYYIKFTI